MIPILYEVIQRSIIPLSLNTISQQAFLLREVSVGNLVRMEAVSMLPALALGARPGDLVRPAPRALGKCW